MKIWDVCISILTIVASSYAAFHFGMKGKRREIDLSKNKELNVVLSNLLSVWEYLTGLENLLKILNQNDKEAIIPTKYYPMIVEKSGVLNSECFEEFEVSVSLLKQYDPILYFKLKGFGRNTGLFLTKYINPILFNSHIDQAVVKSSIKKTLINIIDECEDLLQLVAELQNNEVVPKVREYIQEHRTRDFSNIIDEANKNYFEVMLHQFPELKEQNPTLKEFVEFSKSPEYAEVIEFQMYILLFDLTSEAMSLAQEHPSASFRELLVMLEEIRIKKEQN